MVIKVDCRHGVLHGVGSIVHDVIYKLVHSLMIIPYFCSRSHTARETLRNGGVLEF